MRRRSTATLLLTMATLAPVSLRAQEVALTHVEGERIRVAGMPLREFAAGLRLVSRDLEALRAPQVCAVAVVDSNGFVWEEYVSEPFRTEHGELGRGCVPRFPVLPADAFGPRDILLPVGGAVSGEVFFDGLVDWEYFLKQLDPARNVAGFEELFLKIEWADWGPPEALEMEPRWVAPFAVAFPADDRGMDRGYSTRPVMVLLGAR